MKSILAYALLISCMHTVDDLRRISVASHFLVNEVEFIIGQFQRVSLAWHVIDPSFAGSI